MQGQWRNLGGAGHAVAGGADPSELIVKLLEWNAHRFENAFFKLFMNYSKRAFDTFVSNEIVKFRHRLVNKRCHCLTKCIYPDVCDCVFVALYILSCWEALDLQLRHCGR